MSLSDSQRLPLKVLDLGTRPYQEVLNLQMELVEKRIRDQIEDHLLLVEHSPSIVTLGRRSQLGEWAATSLPVIEIERGGGPTYHGKGQLVGYPILKLIPGRPRLRDVLCLLEQSLISTLKTFGLTAECREGFRGVWVEERKIASIGIAAKRWVTYHGFALNVEPDLFPFFQIKPCGLSGEVMTSLVRELERKKITSVPKFTPIKREFETQFRWHFNYESVFSQNCRHVILRGHCRARISGSDIDPSRSLPLSETKGSG